MSIGIYVAFKKGGGIGWVKDPMPIYDQKFCLIFTRTSPIAGITISSALTEEGVLKSNSLCPAVEDALDRLHIPWTGVNKPEFKFASKTVDGESLDYFLVKFELIGPLPEEVADRLGGFIVDSPEDGSVCYGGCK